LILHFRDDISAFNAEKLDSLTNKGRINNLINTFIMQKLEEAGVPTHFEEQLSDEEALVKCLDMIPVESVVRNITTGSLCRRLGIKENIELKTPLLEFFLKNDELGDPLITDNHIRTFEWASDKEIETMKSLSLQVNDVLKPLFLNAELLLVDFKLEFGRFNEQLILGDEFTPDACRLWDVNTREKLDKDRFRKDLGNVVESYEQVARRLGINV